MSNEMKGNHSIVISTELQLEQQQQIIANQSKLSIRLTVTKSFSVTHSIVLSLFVFLLAIHYELHEGLLT